MATPRVFAQRMRELGRRIEENAPAIARKAALAINQAVVSATPVDTGTARVNWQAQVGRPTTGEVPAPISPGAAIAQQSTQAQAVIRTYRGDSSIHLTNNLPYIRRLNDGYSSQAPANYVQGAVQAGVNAVRGARLLGRDNR